METSQAPAVRDPSIGLMHDARAVHDTAALLFKEYSEHGMAAWIVAGFQPAADSGAAMIPGSNMDPQTFEVTVPPGAQTVMKKSGAWTAIAWAPGVNTHHGTYSWTEPLESHKHVASPEDYYSPFVYGGTAVFALKPGAVGKDQFVSLKLIFEAWAELVQPAFAFVQRHSGLLENGEQHAVEIARLSRILTESNSLLVTEAFRELAKAGHLDANVGYQRTREASHPLDAICSYIMLTARGEGNLANEVSALTFASDTEAKLESIALSVFAALVFCSREPEIVSRGGLVLQHVRERLRKLNIEPERASNLRLILDRVPKE